MKKRAVLVFMILVISGVADASAQRIMTGQGNDSHNTLLNGTINGSGIAIATGETLDIYQEYSLHILGIDIAEARVMIRLLHDNDVVSQEWTQVGDSFTYSKPAYIEERHSNNNSKDYENNTDNNVTRIPILSITVDSLYEGDTRDLVMLYPIYQYMDTEYKPPATYSLSQSDEEVSNKTPLNNNSNESPSAGISVVISIMVIIAAYIQIKHGKRG